MAPLPPPFPKALPSLLGGDRQWEWATWKVKWEIKNLRGEVRDVTTTGEAGEKKENIIGERHACSSRTPKALPRGRRSRVNGSTVAQRQTREDAGRLGTGRFKRKKRWGCGGGGGDWGGVGSCRASSGMRWRQWMAITADGELLPPWTRLRSKPGKAITVMLIYLARFRCTE